MIRLSKITRAWKQAETTCWTSLYRTAKVSSSCRSTARNDSKDLFWGEQWKKKTYDINSDGLERRKTSEIQGIPVLKRDHFLPVAYHPISCLNHEKQQNLEKTSACLTAVPKQVHFRPNRSTVDHIICRKWFPGRGLLFVEWYVKSFGVCHSAGDTTLVLCSGYEVVC